VTLELIRPQLVVVVVTRDLERLHPLAPHLVLERLRSTRETQVVPVLPCPTAPQSRAEVVRALRTDETHAVDVELVPLRLAADPRMVVEPEHSAGTQLLAVVRGAGPGESPPTTMRS
jgi:hypothetical protein